jgi:phage-related protein
MSKQAGVSDDVLRPALEKAVRGTGDLGKAQDLLKIGLDAAAATGKPLGTVMQTLTKATNGHEEALYKLNPGLEKTKGGLEEFAASVKGAAGTNASPMAQFSTALDEAKETIGTAFMPVLEKLIQGITPLIDKIAPVLAKLIGALAPIFLKVVDAIIPLIDDLLPPLIDLLDALMPVIEPLVDILKVLLVPIIKLLADVIKGVLGFIKPLLDAFANFAKKIPNAFEGVGKFFKGLVNGYIAIWEGFINFFIDGINLIPNALNKIHVKLPDWLGGHEIGFKIPTVGHVKIPRLANGGIVMPSPGGSLVNVAEAGKAEAIIPLDRMGGMGGNTYNININKASITGEEIVQAIRRYEISRGRTVAF